MSSVVPCLRMYRRVEYISRTTEDTASSVLCMEPKYDSLLACRIRGDPVPDFSHGVHSSSGAVTTNRMCPMKLLPSLRVALLFLAVGSPWHGTPVLDGYKVPLSPLALATYCLHLTFSPFQPHFCHYRSSNHSKNEFSNSNASEEARGSRKSSASGSITSSCDG